MSPPGWASVVTLKVAFPPSPFTWDQGKWDKAMAVSLIRLSHLSKAVGDSSPLRTSTPSTLCTHPHLEHICLVVQVLVLCRQGQPQSVSRFSIRRVEHPVVQ
jgi:hypothetical protein